MQESEFLELIQQHNGIIQKIVFLYIDDQLDREDVRQEIVLQAWKSIHSFKGTAKFSTWLYRVALNTVLTFQKRKKQDKLSLSESHYDLPQIETHSHPKSDLLFRCIKQLPDVDKAIITLHFEGYDNQGIAEILGLTKNHIAVKLHRIKEHLTQKLKPHANG